MFFNNKYVVSWNKSLKKIPSYGRHWISWLVRKVTLTPKSSSSQLIKMHWVALHSSSHFALHFTVSVLGQEEGYMVKYPFAWRSSWGRSPRNSWRQSGMLTVYPELSPNTDSISFKKSICSWFLHKDHWHLFCILPRECTVKYTPC